MHHGIDIFQLKFRGSPSRPVHSHGFTLLEVLIALVIMSLSSLALFQSLGTMLRVSDQAIAAGETVLDESIARRSFKNIVGGLTPNWPDHEDQTFVGTGSGFRGLSFDIPSEENYGLRLFAFGLEPVSGNRVLLTSQADETVYTIHEIPAQEARLAYMGVDQKWYSQWPPRDPPKSGFFKDDDALKQTPTLPEAIRISGTSNGKSFIWLAAVQRNKSLPPISDITREGF